MAPLMTVAASRDESTVLATDLGVQNGCGGDIGCAGAGAGADAGADADAPAVGGIFADADADEELVGVRERTPCCDTRAGETRGDNE